MAVAIVVAIVVDIAVAIVVDVISAPLILAYTARRFPLIQQWSRSKDEGSFCFKIYSKMRGASVLRYTARMRGASVLRFFATSAEYRLPGTESRIGGSKGAANNKLSNFS